MSSRTVRKPCPRCGAAAFAPRGPDRDRLTYTCSACGDRWRFIYTTVTLPGVATDLRELHVRVGSFPIRLKESA